MANPLSPMFDWIVQVGLPHYEANEHCWCKPVVITLDMDTNDGLDDEIIFHNYATPFTDEDIHATFRNVMRWNREYKDDDGS